MSVLRYIAIRVLQLMLVAGLWAGPFAASAAAQSFGVTDDGIWFSIDFTPPKPELRWEDFARRLPDRDRVVIQIEENVVEPWLVEFVLATPRLNWAKFVDAYWVRDDGQSELMGRIWTADRRRRDSMTVPADVLSKSRIWLDIGKAKFLGVWTGMYLVRETESKRLRPGSRVTFTWLAD